MQTGRAEPRSTRCCAVDDPVRREQYLDFLKGRMFRQTLLCRAERASTAARARPSLERLAVSSPARAGAGRARAASCSRARRGSTLTTDHPA